MNRRIQIEWQTLAGLPRLAIGCVRDLFALRAHGCRIVHVCRL